MNEPQHQHPVTELPDVYEEKVTTERLSEVALSEPARISVPTDEYMGAGTSDGGTMEFCQGRESLEGPHE